ncbi:MAG: hypothetical protein HYZ92_05100 [Candidatus Omnitrophica bacterium]|nr:hypothetical protein [Candidatus Omnitrophota bacterium]
MIRYRRLSSWLCILVTLRRRRQALGTGYGGILGREHVHIMDGDLRRFDAYDSSSGPYTPSSRISADVLRTNSQHPEQLMMPQSGADVWGRLAVGPGLTDQGQIDQVVKNLPEIRWYEGGPEPYSPASGFSAPLVAFVPGDNCADGSLDLAGTQRVTLDSSHNGGRYYFCNADSGNAVSLSGTSELVATGGGAILVYVNGDLVVHDHASIDSEAGNTSLYFVVNRDLDLQTGGALGLRNSRNEEDPTKLRFYVAYQGHRVDLASPPDDPSTLRLYGLVYAPDRHVNVTGNGRVEVSGGLVGRSIQVHSSEFELHADLALERSAQTAPQGSETVIEILSWSAP